MGQAADWFANLSRKGKPVWDEAAGLANLIPDSLTSLSPDSFVEFFARKRFEADDASRQLESERITSLPQDLCEEEFRVRRSFLTAFNVVVGIEGILLQLGPESTVNGPLSATLKLALQPLWSAFLAFSSKRLELWEKALSGFDKSSQQVRRLVSSFPFSKDLFGAEEVEALKSVSLTQAKPIPWLLTVAPPSKRPSSQGATTPKRRRGSTPTRPVQQQGRGRGRGRGRGVLQVLQQPQQYFMPVQGVQYLPPQQ